MIILEKHKAELIFLIPLFIVVVTLIFVPFWMHADSAVSFDASESYQAQEVHLDAAEDSSFELNLGTNVLSSFSISGVVKGTGNALVYLQSNDGQKLLVYSEAQTKKPTGITGFSVASDTNYFEDMCKDTCYFTNVQGPYTLYVDVDPGTSIKIYEVIYK